MGMQVSIGLIGWSLKGKLAITESPSIFLQIERGYVREAWKKLYECSFSSQFLHDSHWKIYLFSSSFNIKYCAWSKLHLFSSCWFCLLTFWIYLNLIKVFLFVKEKVQNVSLNFGSLTNNSELSKLTIRFLNFYIQVNRSFCLISS